MPNLVSKSILHKKVKIQAYINVNEPVLACLGELEAQTQKVIKFGHIEELPNSLKVAENAKILVPTSKELSV